MGKHTAVRMCVACRTMRPTEELIRFVRELETGEVMPDTDKKLFGRGAYICKNSECIRLAAKRKGLERHFKRPVSAEVYSAAEDWIINQGQNDRKG